MAEGRRGRAKKKSSYFLISVLGTPAGTASLLVQHNMTICAHAAVEIHSLRLAATWVPAGHRAWMDFAGKALSASGILQIHDMTKCEPWIRLTFSFFSAKCVLEIVGEGKIHEFVCVMFGSLLKKKKVKRLWN